MIDSLSSSVIWLRTNRLNTAVKLDAAMIDFQKGNQNIHETESRLLDVHLLRPAASCCGVAAADKVAFSLRGVKARAGGQTQFTLAVLSLEHSWCYSLTGGEDVCVGGGVVGGGTEGEAKEGEAKEGRHGGGGEGGEGAPSFHLRCNLSALGQRRGLGLLITATVMKC